MVEKSRVHYILIRDFLQPWARKYGAKNPDWQEEVFGDITGGRGVLTVLEKSTSQGPALELNGRRFSCRAGRDNRRADTLFVYEIHPKGTNGGGKPWSARWQLARGDRWCPDADPLDGSMAPAAAGSNETLTQALERAVGALPSEALLGRMQSALPPNAKTVLSGLREAYGQLEPVLALASLDEPAQHIVAGYLTPADDSRILHIHSRFDEVFLERVLRRQSARFDPVVKALIPIPPVQAVRSRFVSAWLVGGPPGSFEDRAAAVVRWAAAGDSEQDEWSAVLLDARERRINLGRSDVISRELARALGSWPELQAWASPRPAARADTISVATKGEVAQPDKVPESDKVKPSDGSGAPASERNAEESVEDQVRGRVRQLRASSVEMFRSTCVKASEQLLESAQALRSALARLPDPGAAQEGRELLRGMKVAVEATQGVVPEPEVFKGIEVDVERAMALWREAEGLALPPRWFDRIEKWEDVEPVMRVLAMPSLRALPEWFVRALYPTEVTTFDALFASVTDRDKRSVLERAAQWIVELQADSKESVDLLSDCAPGPGTDPLAELQQAYSLLRTEISQRAKIDADVAKLGTWAKVFLKTSDLPPASVLQTLDGLVDDLEALCGQCPWLSEQIVLAIKGVDGPRAADQLLKSVAADVRTLGELARQLPTLDALRLFADKLRGAAPQPKAAPQGPELDVAHCMSDGAGVRAARLVARPDPGRSGLFLTDIPINVRCDKPRALELKLALTLPYLEGRPAEWIEIGRERVITIDESAWVTSESGFVTAVVLKRVPVTRQRTDGSSLKRIDLGIRGHDEATGLIVKPRELAFDEIAFEMPPIELPFSDTTSPEEMRRHPLGIQIRFDEIARSLKSGRASVLVAAPRRFGKTTLLNALMQELADSEVVAIGPVPSAARGSAQAAFLDACEQLGRVLGVHVPAWPEKPLPDDRTFDAARAEAARRGKKAIYLLFDESQALFGGRRGKATAELLKVRLEQAWGRAGDGMAPLRIVLVGQLHLQRLIKGQLDALFTERWEEIEIRPDLIERLLRESTRGVMQSTTSARRLMANVSRNLYILRVILQEIRSLLNEEQRSWFVKQDVRSAVERYIEKALSLDGSAFASYVRDPLNASEDLTEWRPIRAYPVALAWAVSEADSGRPRASRIERVRQLLEGWARQHGHQLTIEATTVEEALQELRDSVVIAPDERFQSELLQRFFQRLGESAAPLREPLERDAMRALSVDRISPPDESALSKVGEGGQATVFLQEVEPRLAWRFVELPDERSHVAFVEMCHALKALEGTRARLSGYQSLAVVKQAGITVEREPRGAVVYEWVDGDDLSSAVGVLSDAAVVELGRQIAEALVVLASRGVVHRDIRPSNIVRGLDGVPVLVDFGLAKLTERSGHTAFEPSKYLAPEVRTESPNWTALADVYALGVTLEELRQPQGQSAQLTKVLSAARALRPEARLRAERLASELNDLRLTMGIEERRQGADEEFTALLSAASPEVRQVGTAHLRSMVASSLGLFAGLERLAQAAAFLDDLYAPWFNANHSQENGAPASSHLAALDHLEPGGPKLLAKLKCDKVLATGHLRHHAGHRDGRDGSLRRARQILRLTPGSDEGPLRIAVLETARRLEEVAGMKGCRAVLDRWLS